MASPGDFLHPLARVRVGPCHVQHLHPLPQWWPWGLSQPAAWPATQVPAPSLSAWTFATSEHVQATYPGCLPHELSIRDASAPPASYLHHSLPTASRCPVPRSFPDGAVPATEDARGDTRRWESGDVSDRSSLHSWWSVQWSPHVQPAPRTTEHHL